MGDYAIWKMRGAVSSLASSDAPLQTRLFNAAIGWGPIVSPRDFPTPETAKQYDDIHALMTAVSGSDGSFRATTDAMSDSDAEQIAEKIVSLAFDLWSHEE